MYRRYFDDEEKFFRSMMFAEEDRAIYTTAKWDGGVRWFRSPNVVCLEKYRRSPRAQSSLRKPAA
jgi:hypothetical protein